MGKSKEWIVEIKLVGFDDRWLSKTYKNEKEANEDLGFKHRQLKEMCRGRYKKCSEGIRVTRRDVIKV